MQLLVSNNSEVLRHLATKPFRGLEMDLLVVTGGIEAIEVAGRKDPVLALLDAEMSDVSGYEAARAIKHAKDHCRVVLLLGRRVSARHMRMVAESGCDDVLITPGPPDALYDVVAAQLKLPRRAHPRQPVELAMRGQVGQRGVRGRLTNLSVDGARALVGERIEESGPVWMEVQPDGEPPLPVEGRVVWARRREHGSAFGISFDGVAPDTRRQLARLTQWDVIQGAERTRVVLRGGLGEQHRLGDVMPDLYGKIDFDLSQVTHMDAMGVADWVEFLDQVPVQDYEFHACSVAFALQASLLDEVIGSGIVVSFFAPYACQSCDHREERLLQTAAVLAAGMRRPPTFSCSRCDGSLVLADSPERYFAFLRTTRVA